MSTSINLEQMVEKAREEGYFPIEVFVWSNHIVPRITTRKLLQLFEQVKEEDRDAPILFSICGHQIVEFVSLQMELGTDLGIASNPGKDKFFPVVSLGTSTTSLTEFTDQEMTDILKRYIVWMEKYFASLHEDISKTIN